MTNNKELTFMNSRGSCEFHSKTKNVYFNPLRLISVYCLSMNKCFAFIQMVRKMNYQKQKRREVGKKTGKEGGIEKDSLGLADSMGRNYFASIAFCSCCHGFSHWYIGQIFSNHVRVVFICRWGKGLKMMVLILFHKCPDCVGLQKALGSGGHDCLLTTRKSIEKINWSRFLQLFII